MKDDFENLRFRIIETPDGWAGIVCSAEGLRRSYLPEKSERVMRNRIAVEYPGAREVKSLEAQLSRQIRDYFRGRPVEFSAAYDWGGSGATAFQRQVYEELVKTDRGETLSYGELALRCGRPGAARGVGSAMARNPYPPLIPCHRVLAANGSLGGYSGPGGLDLKTKLLEIEST